MTPEFKVSIGRCHPGGQVRLQILLPNRVQLVELEMTPEAFGNCVTGLSEQSAKGEIAKRPELFDATPESKVELVNLPNQALTKERAKACLEALAPFEVDGWVGYASDLGNMHRRVIDGNLPQGVSCYRVTFHRWVKDGKPVLNREARALAIVRELFPEGLGTYCFWSEEENEAARLRDWKAAAARILPLIS